MGGRGTLSGSTVKWDYICTLQSLLCLLFHQLFVLCVYSMFISCNSHSHLDFSVHLSTPPAQLTEALAQALPVNLFQEILVICLISAGSMTPALQTDVGLSINIIICSDTHSFNEKKISQLKHMISFVNSNENDSLI